MCIQFLPVTAGDSLVACVNNQLRVSRPVLGSAPLSRSIASLPPPCGGRLAAMIFIVLPGSTPEGYWKATGYWKAMTDFFHSQLDKQSYMHFNGMLYTLA